MATTGRSAEPGELMALISPFALGLQDKLNKRDKEVTALTSQTEMLRAQVSGKSPSVRAEAGVSLGPRTVENDRVATGSGRPPALCREGTGPGPALLRGSREWGTSPRGHNIIGDPSQLLSPAATLF